MNPLAIELVYEAEKGGPVCEEKAPEPATDEITCTNSADKDISQTSTKFQLPHQTIQDSSLGKSTESSFGEAKDIIIVTPSPGNQKPAYPLRAREENIEGTVFLRLTIGPSGQVLKAIPLSPRTHPLLEKSALETVYQHIYIISGPARTIICDRSFEFCLGD